MQRDIRGDTQTQAANEGQFTVRSKTRNGATETTQSYNKRQAPKQEDGRAEGQWEGQTDTRTERQKDGYKDEYKDGKKVKQTEGRTERRTVLVLGAGLNIPYLFKNCNKCLKICRSHTVF